MVSTISHFFSPKASCQAVLLGKAGSGKGTHAIQLRENLNLPLISFGELLKESVRNQTPVGKILKHHIEQGTFAPDHFVIDLLFSKFLSLRAPHGWIIEGFPRTLYQAQLFDEKCPDISKPMKVIYLELSDEIAAQRVLSRLMCSNCFATYNTLTQPPATEGICDICHRELHHREDDNEQAIKTRLQMFREKTIPVIDHYRQRGNLFTIDSNQPIEKIYGLILGILQNSQ